MIVATRLPRLANIAALDSIVSIQVSVFRIFMDYDKTVYDV